MKVYVDKINDSLKGNCPDFRRRGVAPFLGIIIYHLGLIDIFTPRNISGNRPQEGNQRKNEYQKTL